MVIELTFCVTSANPYKGFFVFLVWFSQECLCELLPPNIRSSSSVSGQRTCRCLILYIGCVSKNLTSPVVDIGIYTIKFLVITVKNLQELFQETTLTINILS